MIKIYTLGKFQVENDDTLLSDINTRSRKMWNLFQTLISNPQNYIPVDNLIEELNFSLELIDAKNALENTVYRLRKLLAQDKNYRADKYIIYSHGAYSFNWDSEFYLDYLDFTEHYKIGAELYAQRDYEKALSKFTTCLNLYRGHYLQQNKKHSPLLQRRSHLREQFLDLATATCNILYSSKKYDQLEKTCQQVLEIEPLAEEFHILKIRALIRKEKYQKARTHFINTCSLFQKNNIELSSEFSSILATDSSPLEIEKIIPKKNERNYPFLAPMTFQDILRLELRKKERTRENIFLVTLELNKKNIQKTEPLLDEMNYNLISRIETILRSSLRDSDYISRWNRCQYLFLFVGIEKIQVEKISTRIERKINKLPFSELKPVIYYKEL